MPFINDIFYIANIKQGATSTGKPYLCIRLANRTEDYDGRYWDMTEDDLGLSKGDYARVQGTTETFNGQTQIKITHMHRVAPVDMARESPVEYETLLSRLTAVAGKIPDGSLSQELWKLFSESTGILYDWFLEAPAATSMHHNYKHGLLEHSVSVAELVVERVPEDEKGMAIVAALLHDIGKVDTYVFAGPTVEMTEAGKMLGHIVLGVMRLQPLLDGFPEEFRNIMLNAVIGHHGKYEWGSPKLPKTRFAWIIHQADMLDSYAAHMSALPEWNGWLAGDKMAGVDLYHV